MLYVAAVPVTRTSRTCPASEATGEYAVAVKPGDQGAGVDHSTDAECQQNSREGQQHIYYLLAPGPATAKASPHLEAFRKKGIEVLLLSEVVDNWLVSHLTEYEGKSLQSVAQSRPGDQAPLPAVGALG